MKRRKEGIHLGPCWDYTFRMAVRRDIPRALSRAQSRGLTEEQRRILGGLRAQQRAVLTAFLAASPNQRDAIAATSRALQRSPAVRRAFARLWLTGGLRAINIIDGLLGLPPDPPPDAVVRRRIIRGSARRVRMVDAATRRAIRRTIARGFEAGLTQEQVARGTGRAGIELRRTGWRPLRDIVTQTYKNRADTIARTERALVYADTSIDRYAMYDVTHAVALDGPMCGLRKHGVEPYANGKRYTLETARRWPISHPRCFPAGTRVVPIGSVRTGYRGRFTKACRVIRTATASVITITPNHLVATTRGWVPANRIRVGDDMLRCTDERRMAMLFGHSNLYQVPTDIADVFASLRHAGRHSRVVAAADHLHGDGASIDGEIDVVDAAWGLLRGRYADGVQRIGQSVFMAADADALAIPSKSRLDHSLARRSDATTSCISGLDVHPIGISTPNLDAALMQVVADGVVAPFDLARNLKARLPGLIEPDKVIDIGWSDATIGGHVYDLETSSSMYLAQGMVARNCVRAWAPDV